VHSPNRTAFGFFVPLLVLLGACDTLTPSAPAENEVLDGFVEGLTANQRRQHITGDIEFARRFAADDGLGPVFVAASCDQCHVGDGKGHAVFNLTRFGRQGPNGFDPLTRFGGPQLQHRSIPGYPAEEIPPAATGFSVFTAPAVTGLGYLEAVDDQTLIDLADPDDLDGDGVSGRLQLHPPSELIEASLRAAGSTPGRGTVIDGRYIGRFGKKGLTVNLVHQTVGAYHEDMGITSDLLMEDVQNPAAGALGLDPVADPEVSNQVVASVVFYLQTLRAPARREATHPEVVAGEALFTDIGCASCHTPTLRTGASSIAPLHQVDFHPYTDLLLHDMGPDLDDGYTEGRATTSEWRTPPLWGIGLQARFQGGEATYLHDGRARTLDEAIGFHGGEGSRSRDRFGQLSADDQARLLRFLRSL